MRVVICDNAETAVARVADRMADHIRRTPETVLGLATGGTMECLYACLLDAHQSGLSFAGVKAFNLDEYVGLASDHPQSYAYYMRHHLFNHVDIDPDQCFIPSGTVHPKVASQRYEKHISNDGPIQLQLLGLGHNGHIGFNEPGSSLASKTREKALSQTTLEKNKRFFSDTEIMPISAITMGIQTISQAEEIVLLALGSEKSTAVKGMIEGPVSAFCPASALQMHSNVTVFLDDAASSQLSLKNHYIHTESLQQKREKALLV